MMAALQSRDSDRDRIYQALSVTESDPPNRRWLAQILTNWQLGKSALPNCLGLEPVQFKHMIKRYFPHTAIADHAPSGIVLDYERMLERQDLIQLLQQFSKNQSQESAWMIGLIVSACLGNDHLWQDLGLWQRSELSALLAHNFPTLAARNIKDMKWKKFLYKQLCEAEGLYLCRAPSCEVCIDYPNCFGSEE